MLKQLCGELPHSNCCALRVTTSDAIQLRGYPGGFATLLMSVGQSV